VSCVWCFAGLRCSVLGVRGMPCVLMLCLPRQTGVNVSRTGVSKRMRYGVIPLTPNTKHQTPGHARHKTHDTRHLRQRT
jgi:hypothetical protein